MFLSFLFIQHCWGSVFDPRCLLRCRYSFSTKVIYEFGKISKGFFPSRDPAMSPRGGLTRRRTAEERPLPVEESVGTGVPAHTPGPALSNRLLNRLFPPTESRQNCWQITLPPLQMLPHPSSRGAVSMTKLMRLLLYAMTVQWQWNKDSRPSVPHVLGGPTSLRGRCKLSLNQNMNWARPTNSKGHRRRSADPGKRHHPKQPLQHRHKRSRAAQGQPCTRTMPETKTTYHGGKHQGG